MDDMRQVHQDAVQTLRGPHQALHGNVPPLYLRREPGGEVIVIKRSPAIIGRHSEADVRLGLQEISRRHCRLTFVEGDWRIDDLGSLNGIFVNQQRQTQATLMAGDRVRLGPLVFVVEGGALESTRLLSDQVLRDIAQRVPPVAQ